MENAAARADAPLSTHDSWAGRLLDFASGDRPDSLDGITTFLVILCFHIGCRHLHMAGRHQEPLFLLSGAIALAVAAGCWIESRRGPVRYALPGIALTVVLFASQKIALGNHAALETLVLLAVAIAVPLTRAKAAAIGSLFRWSCIVLFLHSGIQKIVYGAWFNGSFLARRIGDDRFAWLLELVLPAREYLALIHTDPLTAMTISSPLGLLVSNAVYLTEVGCGILLLVPRTRQLGLYAGILTLIGIEVVAREVGFGLMFLLMLLLFRPGLYEDRRIFLLPLGAHLVLGLTELLSPGVLLW